MIIYRFAKADDAALLAQLNKQLIDDEEHRNTMTVPQLEERMLDWLSGGYQAVLFQRGAETMGYALFRSEPDYFYLRQFFVGREQRRKGIGRDAIAWLREHVWGDGARLRLDVLVGNTAAIAFWRSVGFQDYCLTMELQQ